MPTCRLCGEYEFDEDAVVQYGIRHYAHFACYLDRKPLSELSAWKVRQFPYRLLKERGLLEQVAALPQD